MEQDEYSDDFESESDSDSESEPEHAARPVPSPEPETSSPTANPAPANHQDTLMSFLVAAGLPSTQTALHGAVLERSSLLSPGAYERLSAFIPDLKATLSSSSLTALHASACAAQKWPALNLVRQVLAVHGFSMVPKRISAGYCHGKKRYRRVFHIRKKVRQC